MFRRRNLHALFALFVAIWLPTPVAAQKFEPDFVYFKQGLPDDAAWRMVLGQIKDDFSILFDSLINNRGVEPENVLSHIRKDILRHGYFDLNGDGVDELFVLYGHSYYCGTRGCDLEIFEKKGENWTLLSGDSGFTTGIELPWDRAFYYYSRRDHPDYARLKKYYDHEGYFKHSERARSAGRELTEALGASDRDATARGAALAAKARQIFAAENAKKQNESQIGPFDWRAFGETVSRSGAVYGFARAILEDSFSGHWPGGFDLTLGPVSDAVRERVYRETRIDLAGHLYLIGTDGLQYAFRRFGIGGLHSSGAEPVGPGAIALFLEVVENPDRVSYWRDSALVIVISFEKYVGDLTVTVEAYPYNAAYGDTLAFTAMWITRTGPLPGHARYP